MNSKFFGIAGAMLTRVARAVVGLGRGTASRLAHRSLQSYYYTASPLKRRIVLGAGALGLFATAAAIGMAPVAPDASLLPTTRIVQTIALPDLAEQAAQQNDAAPDFILEDRVQRGDSVATLLNRLGVDDPELSKFLRESPDARSLYQLYPGRVVQAATDSLGQIRWLRYIHTPGVEADGKVVSRMLEVRRQPDGFAAHEVQIDTERQVRVGHGEVASSLFAATDDAGIPDSVASQIADILGGEIDFHRGLQRGDHFNVVYEVYTHDGAYVRAGRVIALEFVNKGVPHQAVWFDQQPGANGGYYGFDGHSLRKSFLRAPLALTRVTSGFSMRLHPILGTWRKHTGVDYGAPTGTPIRSTADGTVEFAGWQNGYGKVVVIHHNSKYTTLYGHMSAFAPGISKGTHVAQGQVIGRVGSTGWATGPHLHYEFRVNGTPVDPLTVALPGAPELSGRSLALFKRQTGPMRDQLAMLDRLGGFRMAGGAVALADQQ